MSKFIVFEGIDRAGKSTALNYVEEFLTLRGVPVTSTVTKYIAGNRIPSMIGNYPDEIVYMFFWQAIRLAELSEIKPALKRGEVVLCDRHVLSNLAIEWWEGLESEFKKLMDEIYLDRCLKPDLTLLFTIPYDTFVARDDGAVKLTRARFEAIHQSYLWWGKQLLSEGLCVIFVDGTQPEGDVHKQALNYVLTVLGEEASDE